jgi:hypothetical protein
LEKNAIAIKDLNQDKIMKQIIIQDLFNNGMEEFKDKISESIDHKILANFDKLKDCMYYWDNKDEQCTVEEGTIYVNRILDEFIIISNLIKECTDEYHDILEQQKDDLDIDTYRDLRLAVIDAENHINKIVDEKIIPQIDLLNQLKHNMLKNRNSSDLIKIIDKIKIPNSDYIDPIDPTIFILPGAHVI